MNGLDGKPAHSTRDELHRLEASVRRLSSLLLLGGAFGLAVIALYVRQFWFGLSSDQAVWGQFGDYVGGILNPIFGFLTLIALLWTISLQTKELRLSTDELKKSAAALKAQNDTLKLQSFESTFFQLLRLHNDIVSAMDVTGAGMAETKGRDCFMVFVRELRSRLQGLSGPASDKDVIAAYRELYNRRQRDLGHYFRLLYHIVKFVDSSSVENKKFYTNLVRAQLSSDELRILFFNGLSPFGQEKFKPLIEKYGLLKTLPTDGFPNDRLRPLYEASAYQLQEPATLE